MKVEKSNIRISKLNDVELTKCLEDVSEENPTLIPIVNNMIYRYDPQFGRTVKDVNRYSLQLMLDGLEHDPNSSGIKYIKSNEKLPKEIVEALENGIKKKENNKVPFLYFDKIDYDENGAEVYTACSYPTQESFFKELNQLYENDIDRFYNSPNEDLGQITNVCINNEQIIDYDQTMDMSELICKICDNFRDTEVYSWIPGIVEMDIKDCDQILDFPGGEQIRFSQLEDEMIYPHESEMLLSPSDEETKWDIVDYFGSLEKNCNDRGIFVLKNNEPVHAFLVGSEHSHVYTKAEEQLLKNLAEDYIVKQVIREENTPMRVDMAKYELMGQVLNGNGMRAFTVPALEIYTDQERIKEKSQVILNVPEKPSVKDFVNDLKKLMQSYQNKGVSENKLTQVLTQIVSNNGKDVNASR